MEARLKKIFHRKKDEPSEAPLQQSRKSNAATSTPALRTSLYNDAPAGGPPQTGSYPIKGKDSGAVLPNRRSSLHHRGPSDPISISSRQPSIGNQQNRLRATSITNFRPSTGGIQQTNVGRLPEGDRALESSSPKLPTSDFSRLSLNLNNQDASRKPNMAQSSRNGPTPSFNQPYNRNTSDHVTPDTNLENQGRFSPSHGQGDSAVHTKFNTGVPRRDDPLRAAAGVTDPGSNWPPRLESKPDGALAHTMEGHDRKPTAYSSAPIYNPITHQSIEERPSAGKSSVPRKQVGSSPTGQFSEAQSIPSIGETRSTTNSPPLYMPSGFHDGDHAIQGKERKSHSSDIPDRLNPHSRNLYGEVTGDKIVDKAKSNTVDTEVVEAWAPAVVQETVHNDVHHIREELITREIHNSDIYHRILPVIDVEVLPTRHFLPVEGGGLVEINADEAPGRGRNWVIAETASKIPSDQVAPTRRNRFSAREFVGDEGDAKKYTTPEGVERREETWVHPPTLETGGRDSGQTWPMVFNDDAPQRDGGPPHLGKKKRSHKPSMSQSSPTEVPRHGLRSGL